MLRRNILFFFLTYFICFSIHGFESQAKFAFLIDADTGAVLYEKNSEVPTEPASITKLMTIYMIFEKLKSGEVKLDDEFVVSEKAWKLQGSKMFVPLGSKVKVEDLLRGVVVQSGNDACIVLAEGIDGSEETFVANMNSKAKDIGLTGSVFYNVTGWNDEGHVMTAKDMVTLSNRILEDFPEYYKWFSEKEFTFNNIKQGNRNTLLYEENLGVDGLKTGHTEKGGFGIAFSSIQKGRRLIGAVHGLKSMSQRTMAAKELLNYGYSAFMDKTLFKADEEIVKVPVWLGDKKDVSLVANGNVIVTLPRNGKNNITMQAKYNDTLKAPLKSGDESGELLVVVEQENQKQEFLFPLYVKNDVKKQPFIMTIISKIIYLVSGKI